MTVVYGVLLFVSLLFPVGYFVFLKREQREPWLFTLFACVGITLLGWTLLSASRSLGVAVISNKIAYFGQIFLVLSMFMIISGLCGFKYKRSVMLCLWASSVIMVILVGTTGHLGWYYKSVSLEIVNGAARLVKEYGPLHFAYLAYVLSFFLAMLTMIGVSLKKNKKASQKLAAMMLAVVIGNIATWLVEKLITFDFEFLAISYVMSEGVFFFAYILLQDYVKKDVVSAEEVAPIILNDEIGRERRLEIILSRLPDGVSLSPRQKDVLEGIMDGKSRKRIASDLFLSENTVKMHTSSLYRLLEVSSRDEIFELLNVQK